MKTAPQSACDTMQGLTITAPLLEATITADAILRRCPRCAADKPIAEFPIKKKVCYCALCEVAYKREHYLKNAERIKAKARAWTAANPERKRAGDIAYVNANRDKVRAQKRAYQLAHPEDCLRRANESRQRNLAAYRARESEYRERNRAACNARIKEWKKHNPHALVAYEGKRRAAELRAIPAWANLDEIAAIYRRAAAIGGGFHVDHCVPLISPLVCGLHCAANLQILTASENARKNNRHWPDMWGRE